MEACATEGILTIFFLLHAEKFQRIPATTSTALMTMSIQCMRRILRFFDPPQSSEHVPPIINQQFHYSPSSSWSAKRCLKLSLRMQHTTMTVSCEVCSAPSSFFSASCKMQTTTAAPHSHDSHDTTSQLTVCRFFLCAPTECKTCYV